MSASPPRLLLRDEEDLAKAAHLLGKGRSTFLLMVCPPPLRPAVLGFLRGRLPGETIDEPRLVSDAESLPGMLKEAGNEGAAILSLVLANDDVRTALNWHREKLRRGQARVLVWLDDVDALRQLRQQAPDACSFRDSILLLQGDSGLPDIEVKEPPELERVRMRLKRARTALEQAEEMGNVAEWLRVLGRLDEAREMVHQGLARLHGQEDKDRFCFLRANLYDTQVGVELTAGRLVAAWRQSREGSRSLAGCGSRECQRLRIRYLSLCPAPPTLVCDRENAMAALAQARAMSTDTELLVQTLQSAAIVCAKRTNLRRARRLLRQIPPTGKAIDRGNWLGGCADIEQMAGDFTLAEQRWNEAIRSYASAGAQRLTLSTMLRLCAARFERGEWRLAESLIAGLRSDQGDMSSGAPVGRNFPGLLRLHSQLAVIRGDIAAALEGHRYLMTLAAREKSDEIHFEACADLVDLLLQAYEAERISTEDLATADAELELAEDVVLSIAGRDPPWYLILYPGLRAELLATRPERLPDAIRIEREALALARSSWPELAPMRARALASHLLRSGEPQEALAVIEAAEPEALGEEMLGELARLAALRLEAQVMLGASQEILTASLGSVRQAIADTDSRRLHADLLRDLARRLPPLAEHPDPLALAEEAYTLYLDMPMPAGEARCLELAGDLLLARGRREEARRRYRLARGRLEHFGLALRLPLIERKLAALAPPTPEGTTPTPPA
jgi:tetratricopeptide (TPR) repeat protein